MRIWLLVLFLILVTAVFFILQFDATAWKHSLETSLEAIVPVDVTLGNVAFQWRLPPAVTLSSLSLKTHQGILWLNVKNLKAKISLLELFKLRLTVSRFQAGEGDLYAQRFADGSWNLPFLNFSALPEALDFSVSRMRVHYKDRTQAPVVQYDFGMNDFSGVLDPAQGRAEAHFRLPEFKNLSPVSLSLKHSGARDPLDLKLFAPKQLDLQILIQSLAGEATFEIRGEMARLLLPARLAGPFSGLFSLEFEAEGKGIQPYPFLANPPVFQAKVWFTQGRFEPENMIRRLLEKLAPIPGFIHLTNTSFEGVIGEIYQDAGTRYESLQIKLRHSAGVLEIEDFILRHPLYKIQLHGTWSPSENRMNLTGAVVFYEAFSQALIDRVRTIDVLRDPEGSIVVPLSVGGKFPEPFAVLPDLDYVANRMIHFRGEELASRGIQRINEFLEAHQ